MINLNKKDSVGSKIKPAGIELISINVVKESDRYIYIERNIEGKVIGINYMQGVTSNGLDIFFKDGFIKPNEELTKYIQKEGSAFTVGEIDDLLWLKLDEEDAEREASLHKEKSMVISMLNGLLFSDKQNPTISTHYMLKKLIKKSENLILTLETRNYVN